MKRILIYVLLWAGPAAAVECENVSFESQSFTVCSVTSDENIRIEGAQETDRFGSLSTAYPEADALAFATNAGMFHPDRSAVGYLEIDGSQKMRLIETPGPGNFGMLPNGVFCIRPGGFDVIETLAFKANGPECEFATQSGPMLVIDGALHPRFLKDSHWRNIRNGVGVSDDGAMAHFVISNQPVNFHSFARFFRDEMGLDQALYFDGRVSRFFAPTIGRDDVGFPVGPRVLVFDAPRSDR